MSAAALRVFRVENGDGAGPFQCPHPYSEVALKKYLGYGRILPGFYSLQPTLCVSDPTHPHHKEDVLERHFGQSLVTQSSMFGENLLGEGEWRTGVRSLQQLRHWFPAEALGFLATHGYRAAVYDVPVAAVRHGEYQLLFDVHRAVLRRHLNAQTQRAHAEEPSEGGTRCVCELHPQSIRCSDCPIIREDPK